jgi:hypothetical protein
MRRREFITLLGGAAVAWPVAARAQQRERMRRVRVLTPFAADDAEGQARLTAFAQALQQAGWTLGQNLRLDYHWGDGKPDTMRKLAANLTEFAPDVVSRTFPAMVDLEDWIVLDDGKPIGRIYQRRAPANADVAWFWSVTTYVEPRGRGAAHERDPETLEAAKVAFRATWEQWQSLGSQNWI